MQDPRLSDAVAARAPYPWEPAGDVIAFETPEQTRIDYRLAPFGARVVATGLDLLPAAALMTLLVIAAILLVVFGGGSGPSVAAYAVIGWIPGTLLLWALLSARGEAIDHGRTWGKRKLGLRTLSLTGRRPDLGQTILRNLARTFEVIPLFWPLPTMLASRQRLGDVLAGTIVVVDRERASMARPIPWPAESWRALEDRRFDLPAEAAARLRPADLDLIEYLLRRLTTCPPRRRMTLIRPVVERYVRRLALGPALVAAVEQDPRRFLLELGLQLRAQLERRAA